MTAPPEATTLEAALQALKDPPDPTHLPALTRAATRAADDLELVAEETADRTVRKALLVEVAHARKLVILARKRARQAALTVDRSKLLEAPLEDSTKENEGDAARLAREINDSLRRTTAIVSEEIDRSRAAGNVVKESTRRLGMTRDQHGRYGEGLSSGAHTLQGIRRTEVLANALIIASFAIFFLAAAYVTKRRISNSNISTFVIRPGMTAASIPFRIVGWMVRAIGGAGRKRERAEEGERKVSSSAQKADEAVRAREGREKLRGPIEIDETQNQEDNNAQNVDDDMFSKTDSERPEEEERSCHLGHNCKPAKLDDTNDSNKKSADETAKSADHSEESSEEPPSEYSEDASMREASGEKDRKRPLESDEVNREPVVADDMGIHEDDLPSAELSDVNTPPYDDEIEHKADEEVQDGNKAGRKDEFTEEESNLDDDS